MRIFSMFFRIIFWPFKMVFKFLSKILKILFLPFSGLYEKWYGPMPMAMGGAPVDHSAPDMSDPERGRIKGQFLYVLIALFTTIAVVWAIYAEVNEQVRAEGIIVTPSDVQHVQSRLPGSLVKINVQLGVEVEKGDVLFRLEDEDVLANFQDNEINYQAAYATEIRLKAEISGANNPVFPEELIASSPDVVAQELQHFHSRKNAMQSRLQVLANAVETLERTILEKEAEARIATKQAELYAEELALLEPLVKAGHEPQAVLLAARTKYQQAIGTIELSTLSANARRSDLAGKKREMESIITNFKADASGKLAETQIKTMQYKARQDALEGKVRHADIRAPLSGIVSAVHVKTIGAVVQAGTVLVDIVPSESGYLVRAQVPPQNVAAVQPGQIARISLAAYDPSRYGVLMGVVQRVANNTTQPENQMPFYETMIEIPKIELTKSPIRPVITAGMPLTVDILGDKRTVMNYIMTPIQKSLKTAFREK